MGSRGRVSRGSGVVTIPSLWAGLTYRAVGWVPGPVGVWKALTVKDHRAQHKLLA